MLTPLIQTLRDLVDAHQTLIDNAELKKESLITNNIDRLSLILKEESRLIRQLGRLEEDRVFHLQEYVESLGFVAEELTISQLIRLIPNEEEKEEIIKIATTLQNLIEELKEKNELNTKLIQDALHYVNQSIELITEPDDEVTYQGTVNAEGNSASVTKRSFFDTKA